MEATEGIPFEQLIRECRGKSRLLDLPRPQYLYYKNVDRKQKQDVHRLPCVVRGCEEICKHLHPVCHHHARYGFHVDLKESTIPGAGLGVFIYKSVRAETHLMDYTGVVRSNEELHAAYEEAGTRSYYKISIDNENSMDGRSTICGLGRYVNHNPDPSQVNVYFQYDPEMLHYRIIASKDIIVPVGGEAELFIDYGENYWYDVQPSKPPAKSAESITEEEPEPFVEPDNWPVFPSYRTLVHDMNFPVCPSFPLEELLEMCTQHRILFPLPCPQLMDTDCMDLKRKQTVADMECIVRGCNRICTFTHPICRTHLAAFHIQVKSSTIPGAGKGVFLTRSVQKNTIIMSFTGCFRERQRIYQKYAETGAPYYYVFEGCDSFCIDARSTMSGIARFINHHPHQDEVNVELVAEKGETSFYVQTIRDILVPKGGAVELFLDYGRKYWTPERTCQWPVPKPEATPALSQSAAEPFVDNFPCVPAYESVN